jgi:RNA-directed DNA polymerase
MQNNGLWRYCNTQRCRELIISLNLFGRPDWPESKQIALLYALSNDVESHYVAKTMCKKNGAPRQLFVPDALLKKIQRNILRHVIEPLPVSDYATAYRKGGGILRNAAVHVGQETVLTLDIKDFFSSISFSMVYRYAFPSSLFPPSMRTLLTHLCCYNDYLPQGAPTSAAISNLVMKRFDERMGRWCKAKQIAYSRYCDDMAFSGCFNAPLLIDKVNGILAEMGFELNQTKIHLKTRHQRQLVTGIVTNIKAQTPVSYRKALRQQLYYCRKYGVKSHIRHVTPINEAITANAEMKYLLQMLGKVNYILQVNPADREFLAAKVWLVARLGKTDAANI